MKSFALIFVAGIGVGVFALGAVGETMDSLKSFEGQEPPKIKYVLASDSIVPNPDWEKNITDVGDHTVRMLLHYNPAIGWDGDQATKRTDRQRAEVKGLGPHQKLGETFEYETTWRTDPKFVGGDRFCHIFQLKATNGDDGAPLVTMSILQGRSDADVDFWSGDARNSTAVRRFHWKPGQWMTVRIRIKTSTSDDGLVMASINGDPFAGVQHVPVFRPEGDDYRPKWGLYRGVDKNEPFGDDWIEHKDVSAQAVKFIARRICETSGAADSAAAGAEASRCSTRPGWR